MREKIKKYNNFINESSYINEFKILYDNAPDKLKDIVDATKLIEQNPIWHPEGNVYNHTKIVTNRLHNKYNDINITLSGFFHDLGKIGTTKWDKDKKTWTAHGHEIESVDIIEKYKDWILKMGGNIKIIEFIVNNHMRIKYLDEFRLQEKIKFLNEPFFEYVRKFTSADYGGTDLNCEPLLDLSSLEKEISEYNKREEERKIISSKFNGKMVMDKYPELKGKELGDILGKFKEDFDDFSWYVLNTPTYDIMKRFDEFYNKK